jgi:hypothetical protein
MTVSLIHLPYKSLQHALSLPWLYQVLLRNGFQQWLFLHALAFASGRLSQNKLGLVWRLPSDCSGWSRKLFLALGSSHTWFQVPRDSWLVRLASFYGFEADSIENTVSNSSFVVVCLSVVALTWLGCRGNMFSVPLPSNGRLLWFCYTGTYVTLLPP